MQSWYALGCLIHLVHQSVILFAAYPHHALTAEPLCTATATCVHLCTSDMMVSLHIICKAFRKVRASTASLALCPLPSSPFLPCPMMSAYHACRAQKATCPCRRCVTSILCCSSSSSSSRVPLWCISPSWTWQRPRGTSYSCWTCVPPTPPCLATPCTPAYSCS